MTQNDYERKFRPLAAGLLSQSQTDSLLDRLWNLEEVRDIGEVLALTVPDQTKATVAPGRLSEEAS
jgi:hypothetical protein